MPTEAIAPYLDQYFGLWAMAEDRFFAEFEYAKKLNLHVHLESGLPAQAKAAAGKGSAVESVGAIAVIGLHGKLMKQQSSMGSGTSTVQVRRQVRAAMRDPDIAAIMLHIDSPGGTVAGTAELAEDVADAAARKPVHAFVEDLGASAAYWVASQATRITTNPTGQVGSIGTYGVVYDYSGAAAMEGIKAHVVRAGKFKGAGTPGTEITQELLSELQRNVDVLNEHFLKGVAAGRKMTLSHVRELADGRVHVGSEAKALGLVDAVESFDNAFSRLQRESSKRSKSMTMSNHVAPEASAAEEQPVTATVAEHPVAKPAAKPADFAAIKAGCPGADADFICQQLEANATLAQAQSAWMAEQNRRIAAAREEAKQAAAKKPGVEAVRETANGKPAGETAAGNEFWSIVKQKQAGGVSREKAISQAVKENPEAHQAMLDEANAGRKPRK